MRYAIPSIAAIILVTALSATSSLAQGVAVDALVAKYALDGHALDGSGNGFDGVISGATATADRFGREGGALYFNGTNASVDLGNRTAFNFTNSFTLTAWVKTDGGINAYILGKYSYPPNGNYSANSYGLGVDEFLRGYGFVVGSVAPYREIRTSQTLNDGAWHVMSLSYDGNESTLRIYADGDLRASQFTGALHPFVNNLPLLIGKISSGLHFKGSIDEVSIHNRALTGTELEQLHQFHFPVTIHSGPTSLTVTNGQPASFSVIASNSLPLVYQWFHNGAPVNGGTNETLGIANAAFADAGTYTVLVSGASGSVLSAGAVLNVVPTDVDTLARLSVSNLEPTNAPIKDIADELLAGPSFLAQLFAGPSTETLTAQGPAVPFLSGEGAGYFAPVEVVITNVVQGSNAFVQIRVWETAAGSTYEQAVQSGGQYGNSLIIESSTGGGAILLPALEGLTSFSLVAAPRILTQPSNQSVLVGETAEFEIGTWGSNPRSYQWFLNSNAVAGVNSPTLTLTNLQLEHSGELFVVVTNSAGAVTSSIVTLLVQLPDTNAPIVTITSPAAGSTFEASITLAGNVSDDRAVQGVFWQRNGSPPAALNHTNGQFSAALPLLRGSNIFRVTAVDTSGNGSFAEVAVTNVPSRSLFVGEVTPHQEGEFISVPVFLESRGDVGGLSFSMGFDRNFLADPHVEWGAAVAGAVTQSNTNLGTVLLSFALSGNTLPTGSVHVATIEFRSRSVPFTRIVPLPLYLTGVFDANGDDLPAVGTEVVHGSVQIRVREYIGDNNANDRLDVGDASTIMRLANRVELPRAWDVQLNDLNRNLQLDAGDVIRVLRAVVGLDPQPGEPPMQAARLQSFSASSPRLSLLLDKPAAAAGDQVKLTVNISQLASTIAAASFRLNYPTNALKLEGTTAHRIGSIVPAGAAAMWNISPAQNNYQTQNGLVALAVTSDRAWPTNQGAVAEFTFTVQPGATNQHLWNVTLSQGEIFTGELLLAAAGGQISFIGRNSVPPTFTANPVVGENGISLSFGSEQGLRYRLEVSENLVDWSPITTITGTGGQIDYTAQKSEGATQQFFRAVQLVD
jgi:hypothetical protein